MKQKLIILSLVTFAIALCIASIVAASEGGSNYDNKSVKGMWGFSGSWGVMLPPITAEATPFVGVGTVYFDGNGGCALNVRANVNGSLVGPLNSNSCDYSINPDGTGSSTAYFTDPAAPPSSSVAFVIVGNGKELRMINSDAILAGLVAKRQ